MLATIREVTESDRWNSFDRLHETSAILARHYEASGARTEVDAVQTGGWTGTGRWIIREAADVRAGTVDVVEPIKRPVLDYTDNPWHVIQWGTSTPAGGVRCRMAILDSREEIDRIPRGGLSGCMVLTRLSPQSLLAPLADRGAVGVIVDSPVEGYADALHWQRFGWGGVPLEHATIRLVGFVLSARQGKTLRKLAARHGELTLHVNADIHRYVGIHDVVSGLVRGAGDPQDEVWAIAHGAEPGAVDNASGVVACVEIARVLEGLIRQGALRRPRRTIRLVTAYECYGFFAYLERTRRLQTPLAGVCIDCIGLHPDACDGRLEWHATIPMSAGFVDRIGEAALRQALRLHQPGYRLHRAPFVSTADTLIGDARYGFPCPFVTTMHRRNGSNYARYHTSADTPSIISTTGMEATVGGMAAYLYYLADMGNEAVMEIASRETQRTLVRLQGRKLRPAVAAFERDAHRTSLHRLRRWLWGGGREELLSHLGDCEDRVTEACGRATRRSHRRTRVPAAARQVPHRTAPLSPDAENTPPSIARRIEQSGLARWALFWADGRRSIADIAAAVACEDTGPTGRRDAKEAPEWGRFVEYFEAHAELGYVQLIDPADMATRARLVRDLRELGVENGMDVIVHSALSSIGPVTGGADTVVEALLQAVGRRGNLLMPSFNHEKARVYNPLTTPTTNGAIPDAMWRRRDAVRSNHPTHAVAAIGARAREYCRDHLEAGVWAPDSPIGKLVHGEGYILALGTTHGSSTAYHVAEVSVPCSCIDMFASTDRVVLEDGEVRQVQGLAYRSGLCPVPTSKMDEALDRRGLQRRGKVGQAECALVRALDLWKVRREHLSHACPTCGVKPDIRAE